MNYDGQLLAKANTTGFGVGTLYDFAWTVPVAPVGISIVAQPVIAANGLGVATFTTVMATDRIGQGGYTVLVTNQSNSCQSTGTATIVTTSVPMSISTVTATNVNVCLPMASNGSGTVVTITETPGPGNTANYTYTWDDDPLMGSPFVSNNALVTQGSLSVGTYYVTGKRNAVSPPVTASINGSGCVTAPAPFTVLDKRVFPTVSFATTPSTSCDNNFDGSIIVTASTASGPGAGANYNFVWTNDPDGAGATYSATNSPTNNTASPFSTLNTDKIGPLSATVPGQYDIRVTNFTTGCFSDASALIVSDPAELEILSVSKQDQVLCNPDGSISVLTLNVGVPANYTFSWFRTDPTTSKLVDGASSQIVGSTLQAGAGAGQYPTMGAGTYFVSGLKSAVNPGSGCSTAPFRVDIKDVHVNPAIAAAVINPDINCAGGPGVGRIFINEPTPLNFTYSWFTGNDITGTPVLTVGGANGEILQTLQEGDYTVLVRSNATNCTSVARYTIANNPTLVRAVVSAPAILSCNLATGVPLNSAATITSIFENGASQAIPGSYTFKWTDFANTVLQNSAAVTLNNLGAQSYVVRATNSVSNCFTDLDFKIDDKTIGSTTVSLSAFQSHERCVEPKDGFLIALGAGTGTSYTYEWFAGDQRPSPAGIPLKLGNTLSNITVLPGQSQIIFTVKVINSTNNCWGVDAYTVPLIMNPVVISASANPLTFCNADNGEIFSITQENCNSLLSPATCRTKFDYNFSWSKGPTVKPVPDFTTFYVQNLPAGMYTVQATDKADNGCVSPAVTVTIENKQEIPVVTAKVLNDLTICDPTRPDGVGSADVNGDFAHYTFDWFTGNSATGVPFYRGAEVGSLTSITYTVQGTETSTGCFGTASITVQKNFVKIANPTIVIVSNVTSCITDNGELSASVGGVTKDYIFDWAKGTKAPPPIAFTGEIFKKLNAGNYAVIATSRITGCVSEPATAPIIKDQKYPDFDFSISKASCLDPKDVTKKGTDGFITLIVNNGLDIEKVEWFQNGSFLYEGPNLENASVGFYKAKVRTLQGCETEKDVELPAEITPFNGISRREGSLNSYFLIACLDRFESNHVEIFNRAGTKVYEADHYDNSNVLFDGKSNRGISLLGNDLPAGTYFYIISKGDGSERIAGYLELVD